MRCCGHRWKDALVGCFKKGRYPHLGKAAEKMGKLIVYTMGAGAIPEQSRL